MISYNVCHIVGIKSTYQLSYVLVGNSPFVWKAYPSKTDAIIYQEDSVLHSKQENI